MIVDGVLRLHVDDFVGSGEHVHSKSDFLDKEAPDGEYFLSRISKLAKRFRFGSWDFGESGAMLFCGAEVIQRLDYKTITFSLASYIQKVKPITLEKARKTMIEDPCDEREHEQLRALIGALAWPANHCLPQLSASVSLLQAAANKPAIKHINEANKLLRFAKEISKEYKLRIRAHGDMVSLRVGAYSDASCSTRWFKPGRHDDLCVLSGGSGLRKANASHHDRTALKEVDSHLEWCKIFLTCFTDLSMPIEGDEVWQQFSISPVATIAKSLFDATHSIISGMKISERRTAIEVAIIKPRLQATCGELFWVNSHQQLADGLTKCAGRDSMAVILHRGTHRLSFDPNFIAAKKVTQAERERERERKKERRKERRA